MSIAAAVENGEDLPDDVITPMIKLMKTNARIPILVAEVAIMNIWLLDALGGEFRYREIYYNAIGEIQRATEKIVLIPITLNRAQFGCYSSEHWSLLVWFAAWDEWYHYDSINSTYHEEAAHKLATAIHPNTKFHHPQMPRQRSSDCGMYCILYAMEVIDWLKPLNPERCTPEGLHKMKPRLKLMAEDIDTQRPKE